MTEAVNGMEDIVDEFQAAVYENRLETADAYAGRLFSRLTQYANKRGLSLDKAALAYEDFLRHSRAESIAV